MQVTSCWVFVVLGLCTVHASNPPPYRPPADASFHDIPVSIARQDDGTQSQRPGVAGESFLISGTLNVPNPSASAAGDRFPAMFFVSGSGPEDRNGFAPAGAGELLDLGTWELLDQIANSGFVVLRVDDRGFGQTPPGPDGIETEEIGYWAFVSDARICIDYLSQRPEVDPDNVFLIGHSEGSTTVRILAAESPKKFAGIVSMSGISVSLVDVVNRQALQSIIDSGAPQEVIDEKMKIQYEIMNATKDGREPNFDIVPVALWNQTKPFLKYFHEHANIDVTSVDNKIEDPVLITQGYADFQVSATLDAPRIALQLLEGRKCQDVELKLYPDLDHLMKPCGGRKSTAEIYKEDRRVDSRFKSDVVDWLKQRIRKPQPTPPEML